MGIGVNRMAFRDRIPLPGLSGQDWGEWINSFGRIISSGVRNGRLHRYMVLDEMVVETKEIVVHQFSLSDVEDPDLYAAEPLYNWQQSDQGQWVMENALETPVWHRMADPVTWGHRYSITATFSTKKLTEFYLRFGR